MNKKFLRQTSQISLLEESKGESMSIISPRIGQLIMDNSEYFKRSISEVKKGKQEFVDQLDNARRIIFTKEDLLNWLYKIKEDAKTETDMIFARYLASIGMKEGDINFERVGFLAGIYDEAERYLDLIIAIDPLDANKAHYSILDRLEQLDTYYIKTDNIPGYYSVQQDEKISKHQFEIKNLDDFWKDYLSIKDKHEVIEGFGDISFLLRQYHYEFKWALIAIRPREEIRDFLNFHFNRYNGDPIDFLNHIEYRVMGELDGVAGSNYLIYQLLIKDWLKEKRNKLNKTQEEYLLNSMYAVVASFIDNVFEYRKAEDENKYNTILSGFLNHRLASKQWAVKDQSLGGSSGSNSTSNKSGLAFRDLIISNEKNQHVSAIECFRLKYVPTVNDANSIIESHLRKIFINEPIGLSPLFILVYCETKKFDSTWKKYLNYLGKLDFNNYHMINLEGNLILTPSAANIRIAKATHVRETNEIIVYHLFLNLFP